MSIDTIVRVRTHAKVNLFLRVLGLRRDGFHEVETILHGVSLFDEMELVVAESGLDVAMELGDGIRGTLPSNTENLVHRAAMLLLEVAEKPRGARIRVKKNIPIAAGLGGGSADAAGALVTLAEMWDLDIDKEQLLSLAEKLGSDVPYCLDGGTTLATARGEQLTPLPNIKPMWFVLGVTDQPVLTREVYERWDSLGARDEFTAATMTMALGAGDAAEVAALLHNDLEAPAFELRPELESKKQALIDAGALGASMSGSGPTMFAVALTESHAREVASKVEDVFDGVKVVRSHSDCIQRLD